MTEDDQPDDILGVWPFCALICAVLVCAAWLRLPLGATIDAPASIWNIYALAGLVIPFVIIGLSIPASLSGFRRGVVTIGGFCAVLYVLATGTWVLAVLAALQISAAWRVLWSTDAHTRRPLRFAGMFVAALVGWSLAATLLYNTSLLDLMLHRSAVASGWIVDAGVIGLAILLGASVVGPRGKSPSWAMRTVDATAYVLFGVLALRRDVPFAYDDHHVSFFLGPVEALRQGGWLLWDVPSQYGVGMIWTIAHLPTSTSYAAFVYANASLMFAIAAATYYVARTWAVTPLRAIAATLVIIGSQFFFGGIWYNAVGPEHYPSVGPMRFGWCVLLAALIVIAYVRRWDEERAARLLIAGTLLWAFACYWSAESAFFSTVTWMPAAIIVAYRWKGAGGVGNLIGASAAVIGSVAIAVQAVYLIHFDHGPDWSAFSEFGRVFKDGFGSNPLTTLGGVWLLLATYGSAVALGVSLLRAKKWSAFCPVLAIAGMIWSVSSYYVVRSVDNNVDNLAFAVTFALFVMLIVTERDLDEAPLASLLRSFSVPVFCVIAACGIPTYATLAQAKAGAWLNGDPGDWTRVARSIPDAEEQVLTRNGLGPSSRILYLDDLVLQTPPRWPTSNAFPAMWAPAFPPLEIQTLSTSRQEEYLRRFATSHPGGGFAVIHDEAGPITAPLQESLRAVYVGTVVDRLGGYTLVRFDPAPPPAPN